MHHAYYAYASLHALHHTLNSRPDADFDPTRGMWYLTVDKRTIFEQQDYSLGLRCV